MRAVLRLLRGAAGLGVLAWLLSGTRSQPQAVRTGPPPIPPGTALAASDAAPPSAGEESPAGPGIRVVRGVIAVTGLGLLAWGTWLVFDLGTDSWLSLALWLAGGVLGHDALLAPVVVVLGVLAVRLPTAARAPLAVALIVWGSITLVAVPVLGRFGALSDNPTLLDRPYQMSWLIVTGCVVAAVSVASLLRSRRTNDGLTRS